MSQSESYRSEASQREARWEKRGSARVSRAREVLYSKERNEIRNREEAGRKKTRKSGVDNEKRTPMTRWHHPLTWVQIWLLVAVSVCLWSSVPTWDEVHHFMRYIQVPIISSESQNLNVTNMMMCAICDKSRWAISLLSNLLQKR